MKGSTSLRKIYLGNIYLWHLGEYVYLLRIVERLGSDEVKWRIKFPSESKTWLNAGKILAPVWSWMKPSVSTYISHWENARQWGLRDRHGLYHAGPWGPC